MWVWEQDSWPNLTYDSTRVLPHLEKCVQQVSPLKTLAQSLAFEQRLDWESAILLDETLATASIEGEQLDRESVRSSIANKLGIGTVSRIDRFTDGLVEVLLQAIRSSEKPLTETQLKAWHQMMFPVPPIIGEITIGDYRNEAMSVRSGRYGKEKIHFVAPGNTYTLTLELLDNAGADLNPAVSKSVTFTVEHPCDLVLGDITTTCDAVTSANDIFSGTIPFTGGNTGTTYTITVPAGVTFGGDNPDTVAAGTITISGMTEGTNVEVKIVGGTNSSCDLTGTMVSPICYPLPYRGVLPMLCWSIHYFHQYCRFLPKHHYETLHLLPLHDHLPITNL